MIDRHNNTAPDGTPLVTCSMFDSMKAYDELPPQLRHLLAYANHKWSSMDVLEKWQSGYNLEYITKTIRMADGQKVE